METEIWKEIQGYPNYKVSNLGRVKSIKHHSLVREKILYQNKTRLGYLLVALYNVNGVKRISVHRLVGIAFIPNPLNKPCINHIDCNPLNNKVNNLEWVTYSENTKYSFKMGRRNVQGQNAPNSKLKNEDVLQIRSLRNSNNTSTSDLAKKFNVCESSIRQIVRRVTWFDL